MMMLAITAIVLGQRPNDLNLLPNPSFEDVQRGQPAGWATKVWQGKGRTLCSDVAHSGGHSLLIASTEGGDVSCHNFVIVKPYSKYRLSGWIRTEIVAVTNGKGALLNVHNIDGAQTPALLGANDWTPVECVFETGDEDTAQVNCLLGGWGLATGAAWYDDLRLELLETKTLNPTVALDAAKTREPISKYIYGQFIEHLGRCIYGGIWADMLEDRKFYYPVGDKDSPWTPLGEAASVEMIKESAFVGEHTPQVRAQAGKPAGVSQSGLGLLKGRQYVGRIVLAGDAAAAPVEVRLLWGPAEADRETVRVDRLTPDYMASPLQFVAGADTDDARIEIVAMGQGALRIGTASLMPADNVQGMRADTLALLKELNAPIYRWPGGNFVSGYNWKDGIGERDKRPPRKNPAWRGVEHNDFGLDEYMIFCREIGAEPLMVVNTGQGDLQLAAEMLQYANGPARAPMGRLRANNGHPEPYGVKFWGIGNEMYGNWQLGHMPLADYVKKHNLFVDAMRTIDPSIKVIAVGATGPWSNALLAESADHMDLLSEHFYCHDLKGLMSHVRQIPKNIRFKADAQRQYHKTIPALQGKQIHIALDEWNYWYGPELYGEIGVRYFLKDALGIAEGLHEYTRNTDIIFMANYAQTVNVIGCIKTSKTAAAFDTTGLVLKLYRAHYGAVPIEVRGAPMPLDVAAAWTDDHKAITVGVVNPTQDQVRLAFSVQGASLRGDGRLWTITGPDPMAYNEPGKPPQVPINETPVTGLTDALTIPPLSVSLYELPVK